MNIVDKIRVLANKQNMSLPDLELELGLGNGTISRWKTNSPNSGKLIKIADYFDVSVDYLLGRGSDVYDEDIIKINQARKKMSAEDKAKMMKILEVSFSEYFSDNPIV